MWIIVQKVPWRMMSWQFWFVGGQVTSRYGQHIYCCTRHRKFPLHEFSAFFALSSNISGCSKQLTNHISGSLKITSQWQTKSRMKTSHPSNKKKRRHICNGQSGNTVNSTRNGCHGLKTNIWDFSLRTIKHLTQQKVWCSSLSHWNYTGKILLRCESHVIEAFSDEIRL